VLPVDTYSFQWNTNPITTTKNLIAPVSRTYTVRITSRTTGCSITEDVELPGYDLLSAFFKQNPGEGCITLQNPFFEFIDLSQGVTSGTWNFGDGKTESYNFGTNPRHEYADTGKYLVTLYARNEGGCRDTFSLEVCVEQQPVLFVPTAFSPNGDGRNDFFRVKVFGLAHFEIAVFNRWGQKVWESRDPSAAWDGYYLGEPVPLGAYAYVIYYKGFKSKSMEVNAGTVTVVR
jgi:gliding motility-associated-like protein